MTALIATVAGAITLAGAPAQAAAPPNDTIGGAETISVPTTISIDTTEATASPEDGDCVFGSSVWYRLRPTTTGRVRMSTVGSDYDTVLTLFEGPRNRRTFLRCNDDAAGLASAMRPRLEQDRTYWIAISSCCGRRADGGDAILRVFRRSTTPSVSVTVDTVESGGTSGRLLVSGTVTCASDPAVVETRVAASQRVGAGVARGARRANTALCTDDPTPWGLRIDSTTGWAFQPGPVFLEVVARASDGFSRASDREELIMEAVDNPAARIAR